MPRKRDQLPQLGDRQRDLLRAVIREYIATAQPVASAALVRKYRLDLSSATVRNELATLEEFGLLTHPHTSAGRVPTDLGYRYFIESLMPRPSLQPEEQVTVSHQFQQALSNTSEWLRLAASTLARLTTEAAIVTPPAIGRATLRHIEAIPISERRALLVVVFESGAVARRRRGPRRDRQRAPPRAAPRLQSGVRSLRYRDRLPRIRRRRRPDAHGLRAHDRGRAVRRLAHE